MPQAPDTSLDFLGWLTPFVVFVIPYLLRRFAPAVFEMFLKRLERQAKELRDDPPPATMHDQSAHSALLLAMAEGSKRADALAAGQSELRGEFRDTFKEFRGEFLKLLDGFGERMRVRLDSDFLNYNRKFKALTDNQETFEERLTHAEHEIAELKMEWQQQKGGEQ
jgi:hypothetical protein